MTVENRKGSGSTQPRVYIASKTKHAALWRSLRKTMGFISTWIDEAGEGETSDFADLWRRCIEEARTADALVAYHEPGDVWKGAFVEIGAALAAGVPVYVIGDPPGSWPNHPLVTRCASLAIAHQVMRAVP